MKRTLTLLAILTSSTFAELPVHADRTEWLGYFIGWEGRKYDYGVGSEDLEGLLHPKKGKTRTSHKEVKVNFVVQEEIKGKWVTRRPVSEDPFTTTAKEAILNSKKPVDFTVTVTGDTKVEFVHAVSSKGVMVKPKVIEKKTENPIRVGLKFSLRAFHSIKSDTEEEKIEKAIRSDVFIGKRLKDGKKVKVKFSDTEVDLNDEKHFAAGMSELEIKSKQYGSDSFVIEQGSEKIGALEVEAKSEIYRGLTIYWWANNDKLGERDCFVNFGVE
ncbi:MAG: hypothetical protein L7T84_05760 [Akkermansiaceae bacterium]|nr:hypothetical protein [Akkermansiaceae bacterium]